jgi:hypothetical protein
MKRLPMLLTIPAMIMVAAPAYADPGPSNDADFLKQINAAGLTFQDGPKAVEVAKSLCDLADKGTPTADIENNLKTGNPALAGNGAQKFMTLAAAEYCPKNLGSDQDLPAKEADNSSKAPEKN